MGLTEIAMRRATAADAKAIIAIDRQGIETGNATFRDAPYNWASFSSGFLSGRGLAMVAEDQNGVAAWAGVRPTSARHVYRGVGEISIYVASDRRGNGVGRRLMAALIPASEIAGYWTLVAQIFPENEASLKLHAGAGFQTVGRRRKLGLMRHGPYAGQWRDVVMLERRSGRVF